MVKASGGVVRGNCHGGWSDGRPWLVRGRKKSGGQENHYLGVLWLPRWGSQSLPSRMMRGTDTVAPGDRQLLLPMSWGCADDPRKVNRLWVASMGLGIPHEQEEKLREEPLAQGKEYGGRRSVNKRANGTLGDSSK